jgi:hypothetical protein
VVDYEEIDLPTITALAWGVSAYWLAGAFSPLAVLWQPCGRRRIQGLNLRLVDGVLLCATLNRSMATLPVFHN